jgi:hypothetical protein
MGLVPCEFSVEMECVWNVYNAGDADEDDWRERERC